MQSQVFHSELVGIKNQLEKMEKQFSDRMVNEEDFVQKMRERFKSRIKLNVGGCKFETSLTTLTTHPDSMLAAMFSGRFPMDLDDEGYFFIDRDGEAFKVILAWLRTGILDSDLSEALVKKVAIEASFYQLATLEKELKDRGTTQTTEYTVVYGSATEISGKIGEAAKQGWTVFSMVVDSSNNRVTVCMQRKKTT